MSKEITKTEMLRLTSKYHNRWVTTIKNLGENEYSEDIVQEMYLKLYKYAKPSNVVKDGKIKKGYIFFVLKTILYDYRKAKSKVFKIEDNILANLESEESLYSEDFHDFCVKLDSEVDTWHWYDKELFNLYKGEYKRDLSLRKIAKETGISWVSIHNTISKCKEKVRDNLKKDWDELNNKK